MTARTKQQWGDAMNWIFRGLLFIAGIYVVDTNAEVKALRIDVNRAITENAVLRVEVDAHTAMIKEHGSAIRHLEHLDFDNAISTP